MTDLMNKFLANAYMPFQSVDGKNTAYAQVIVEDGHKSLHCIIRIGELSQEFTLVVTNCGNDCHYMLMPQ